MALTYYIMLMAKCMCASLLELSPSALLSCTDSSQPGWFHVETYMCVLGLWYANTAGAMKQVQQWIGRSVHHLPIYITNHVICNILCLNK